MGGEGGWKNGWKRSLSGEGGEKWAGKGERRG